MADISIKTANFPSVTFILVLTPFAWYSEMKPLVFHMILVLAMRFLMKYCITRPHEEK